MKDYPSKAVRIIVATIIVGLSNLVGLPGWARSYDSDAERSLIVGAETRTYLLHVPPSHPPRCSLVLVFHGGGGRAESMRAITGFNRVADEHGFVVVYPQGLGRVWNDGGSNLADRQPRDDISFVRLLIKDVARQVPINERQVFACGFSNGGAMTARLALEASDVIAAAAMVGAGLFEEQAQAYPHPHPIPVMFVEGTSDPCHLFNGGQATGPRFGRMFRGSTHGALLSNDDVISFWRRVNSCTDKAQMIRLPHITDDRTSVTYERWQGSNRDDVVAYIVEGGGHCWPGGWQYFPVNVIGKTTYDFSASEAIWRFFAHHASVSPDRERICSECDREITQPEQPRTSAPLSISKGNDLIY